MPDKEFDLVDDYKSKVAYLKDHFTRMWTRFNFFLTIHSGLFFGTVVASEKDKWWIPFFGILVALLWYVFGAQDRFLVDLYRKEIEQVAENIKSKYALLDYNYIGQTENVTNIKVPSDIHQWRSKSFSTTKLAALFPLAVLLLWIFRALTKLN
jgi:hypothetical protein